MTNVPPQRVSAIDLPPDYALPARPQDALPSVLDAFRQTQFLLGGDLELFAEAQNLQLGLLKDAHPSKYRTHTLAAITGLWSRAYTYLSDGLVVTTRGGYVSALPLVRAACEVIAAQEGLRGGEMDEHTKWLLGTLRPNETFKATEIELGRYFSGEVLASDATLRGIYRPASDLGRPNFGATLLQVAPESNNLRLALSFADTSFHLGWAEIVIGWLMAVSLRQARVIIDADTIFPVSAERRAEYEQLERQVVAALGRVGRCRVEEVEVENNRRYLVQNFRRISSGAPKKVLL